MKHSLISVVLFPAILAACVPGGGPSVDALPDCSQASGSLPNAKAPAGQADASIPIEHVVVIMQENHSFDNYLGRLNSAGYEGQIDGVTAQMSNPTPKFGDVFAYHETKMCTEDMGHGWNAMHNIWNEGKNNRFAELNGSRSMGFYEEADLKFYYALANKFAVGDRFFSSLLSQTFPNRFFLLAASAFGHIRNDQPKDDTQFSQKTIFDTLDQYNVSWKYYSDTAGGYVGLFKPLAKRDKAKFARISDYQADAAAGRLPQVAFIDSDYENSEDEHPDQDVRIGESWVAARVAALLKSPQWPSTALFFTYDEAGGFYDHVAPPLACIPDGIAPVLTPQHVPGKYDRLGFRVPFIAVSPYVKRHFVSHNTYDHTSILKFIELKWNLPALTRRDANADGLLDFFDFKNPDFSVPALPAVERPTGKCEPSQG